MTLTDTATIWASAGALIGGVVVWIAFVKDREKGRKALDRGVRNTLLGLEVELDLIQPWATGGENGLGYPAMGDLSESRAYYKPRQRDWQNPRRFVHAVQSPTISSLTQSPYARHLQGIIREFANLDFSIRAFFKLHDEYRAYVLSQPVLYDLVQFFNVHPPAAGTEFGDERGLAMGRFMEHVYEYNYTLHVDRIGSVQSTDPGCLFHSFANARRALVEFARKWKSPREPRSYLFGHFLAALFFIAGLLLMLGWFFSVIQPGSVGVGPNFYASVFK